MTPIVIVRAMSPEQVTDFVDAVKRMREWQKTYFRTRHPGAMQEAKKWEAKVDRMIEEDDNPGLF
jgi:hypothetical protein